MSDTPKKLEGPDLATGVPLSILADGAMLLGHAHGEAVLLGRRGDEIFAVGATCSHYGGPLAEGLLVDGTIRCPWHHACFNLRTGAPLRAPALNSIACFRVERRDGKIFVGAKLDDAKPDPLPVSPGMPAAVVIVGGGAAGNAAAETLRREGFAGSITLLSADAALPCDRPNLSKNYLAGTADEAWIPLRSPEFYVEQGIDVRLNARVTSIDTATRNVVLADGSLYGYDALLLATGAEPIRLALPGADLPHVHYLRTLADSTALIANASTAKQAVVIGASFIGLEVAASLRARNIEVHVVGRESVLMEKVLGVEVGAYLRQLHEEHGVVFHLDATAKAIDAKSVTLASGETLRADLVVIGIGVRPATALAEQAGLAMDRGVKVDEYLQTSVAGIFAAGDIARWPDPLTGERIRVEHWVVAERMGQTAARNLLGQRERFAAVPFFWTEQYDFSLAYVGHAEGFDHVDIDGDLGARDCTIAYRRGERKFATAVVRRDLEGLREEAAFEQAIAANT